MQAPGCSGLACGKLAARSVDCSTLVAVLDEARDVATFDQTDVRELDQDHRGIVVIHGTDVDVLGSGTRSLPEVVGHSRKSGL